MTLSPPSKNELARSCKNLACKTCLARARDMSLFLHNLAQSCTNSCKICKKSARNSKLTGNYSCSISCKILHHFLQESCKIVQEKGHIACTCQASLACKILARFLHDLASSFLLGRTPPPLPPLASRLLYHINCNKNANFQDMLAIRNFQDTGNKSRHLR